MLSTSNFPRFQAIAKCCLQRIQYSTGCMTKSVVQSRDNLYFQTEVPKPVRQINATKNYSTSQKSKLPDYPEIEKCPHINVQSFLPSNFNQVKYGPHEFIECKEGYVHVYLAGIIYEKNIDDIFAGYGVCFGLNHPLNKSGPVLGKATLNHAKLVVACEAIEAIPKDLFKKVCFCTDSLPLINTIGGRLQKWSENGFRTLRDPNKLVENLQTIRKLNKIIRLNNDIIYRWKYVPNLPCMELLRHANELAKSAARRGNMG